MEKKFLPYGKQNITQEEIESVISALSGDYITQGPLVEKFELSLAKYLGVKHAVVVSNGTAALHIASLALDLKPGDAVIIPAISFVATSNAVLYCGATPIFADVDAKTGNILIESAEEAILLALKKGLIPKAIYPVHYSGLPCSIKDLIELAKKYDIKIVEDSCHALGAMYRINSEENFKMVGSYADMSAWSFHPVKHITTGEGGAVTTNCSILASKLKMLRSHGITKNSFDFTKQNLSLDEKSAEINPWYYEMQMLGYNYRLPDILCALGIAQLKRIDLFIEKRRALADYYFKKLSGIENIILPLNDNVTAFSSFHLFPVKIDFEKVGKTRKQIIDSLKSYGIGCQVHYIPIPWQPYYEKNTDKFMCLDITNAENFYKEELSLPMYYDLNFDDIDRIAEALRYSLGN